MQIIRCGNKWPVRVVRTLFPILSSQFLSILLCSLAPSIFLIYLVILSYHDPLCHYIFLTLSLVLLMPSLENQASEILRAYIISLLAEFISSNGFKPQHHKKYFTSNSLMKIRKMNLEGKKKYFINKLRL